jgi:hypothetical protein
MKKQILIWLWLLNALCLTAQQDSLELPMLQDGRVGLEGIERVDSVGQKELYNRAKIYFVEAFKSAKDVIQMDDPTTGILIGKGIFTIYDVRLLTTTEHTIRFMLRIEVKEGKYRYILSDLFRERDIYSSGYAVSSKLSKPYRKAIGGKLRSLEKQLQSAMLKPVVEKW